MPEPELQRSLPPQTPSSANRNSRRPVVVGLISQELSRSYGTVTSPAVGPGAGVTSPPVSTSPSVIRSLESPTLYNAQPRGVVPPPSPRRFWPRQNDNTLQQLGSSVEARDVFRPPPGHHSQKWFCDTWPRLRSCISLSCRNVTIDVCTYILHWEILIFFWHILGCCKKDSMTRKSAATWLTWQQSSSRAPTCETKKAFASRTYVSPGVMRSRFRRRRHRRDLTWQISSWPLWNCSMT